MDIVFYIIIGFLLATAGSALLNGITDIISAISELLKALISVQIVKCNVAISKLNESMETKPIVRQIGFATTIEEEEEQYE